MKIKQFTEIEEDVLKQLLEEYFNQEFKSDYTKEQIEEIYQIMYKGYRLKYSNIDLCIHEDKTCGFCIYQIDCPQSDWCEKEGYGFIREMYIQPAFRHQGLATFMNRNMEKRLEEKSVPYIYLTCDDKIAFWESCGYRNTGEISKINDSPIFIKECKKA